MTPFLQLQLWWRRASSAERLPAVLAVGLVVALLAWAFNPTTSGEGGGGSTNVAAGGGTNTSVAGGGPAGGTPAGAPAAGTAGGAGSTQAAPGGGAPGTPGAAGDPAAGGAAAPGGAPAPGTDPAAGGGTAAAGGQSCPTAPEGAPGIDDKTVKIDIALLDLAGPIGNGAAGQAPADDMEKLAESVIDDVNSRGGAACRQVEATYYKINPISPNAANSGCIQIVQDRPAAALDFGGLVYANAFNCVAQQQVPTITLMNILPSDAERFFPYLATPSGDLGTAIRDTAQGLKEQGFFDPGKGFKKLGLLMDECAPESNELLLEQLAKNGVNVGQISKYTFSCPENGFASPGDMSQAVVQHRSDRVTHVIPHTGAGSFNTYAENAERQGFRPKYGVSDYQGFPVTATSNLKPNADNFDRSIGITTASFGLHTTPGLTMDEGTNRCVALAEKAGLSKDMVYAGGGGTCSGIWMLEAALNHASSLAPDAILPGVFGAGTLDFAHPTVDATFQAPNKLWGGDTYWPIEWRKECTCWFVLDANRRQSVPA